jgi:hypothetical protein
MIDDLYDTFLISVTAGSLKLKLSLSEGKRHVAHIIKQRKSVACRPSECGFPLNDMYHTLTSKAFRSKNTQFSGMTHRSVLLKWHRFCLTWICT